MHGYLLAISASLCWGIADFLGGLKARSLPVLRVLGLSQPAGLILLTAASVAAGSPLAGGTHALLAVAAGVLSIAALGLFYAAMTKGSMVIVAPLASSIGALLPVLAGLARGEALTTAAAVGIALVLAGTPTAAWQPGGRTRPPGGLLAALLAAAAGAAGGLWFILMNLASAGSPLGATEVMRLTATAVGAALFLWHLRATRTAQPARRLPAPVPVQVAAGPAGAAASSLSGVGKDLTAAADAAGTAAHAAHAAGTVAHAAGTAAATAAGPAAVALLAPPVPARRTRLAGRAALTWLAIAAVGVIDALAEISYATAASGGSLSVISALSSLYPVVTVILAAAVLRERVHPVQGLGVLFALVGAALLAV